MSKIISAQNFLIMNEKKFNKYVSGNAFSALEKLLKEYAELVRAATLEEAAELFSSKYTQKEILDLQNSPNLEIK